MSSKDATATDSAHYLQKAIRLQRDGETKGAVVAYQKALQLDSTLYIAHNNLGEIFASLGDHGTALIFFQAASVLAPQVAAVQANLGAAFFAQRDYPSAVVCYHRAIAANPGFAPYHNYLASALRALLNFADAEAALARALALDPNYAEAYANLAFLLSEQQRDAAEVERLYRKALALKPDLPSAHVNLSHLLLRRGEYAEGWKENEWRWRWKDFPSPKRNFVQPLWRGEDRAGSTILLHAEQGFGDTIQMLRYVPMVAARGAQVVLEVHPELRRLAETLPGVTSLLARGEPLPPFDLHCPLMSLPAAFGTTVASIPGAASYLARPANPPCWLRTGDARHLQVGMVWAGGATNVIDFRRSLTLAVLEPVLSVDRADFHSLQRGTFREPETQQHQFRSALPEDADFLDTAAAIAHLDLVIAVDTAVAHLAGALGKPVWILLPAIADWRWMTARDDSPWYGTARLFRQRTLGDWGPVVEAVAQALRTTRPALSRP